MKFLGNFQTVLSFENKFAVFCGILKRSKSSCGSGVQQRWFVFSVDLRTDEKPRTFDQAPEQKTINAENANWLFEVEPAKRRALLIKFRTLSYVGATRTRHHNCFSEKKTILICPMFVYTINF